MPCLIVHPAIIKLHSELKSETLASVKNMVGIWQEREMANGNPNVDLESVPDIDTLRNLYSEIRGADNMHIALPKVDFEQLLDGKELPKSLVDLGNRLGINIAINRRNHTIDLTTSGATAEDFRLFKALAVDLVYASDAVAEDAFGLSARERLQAIMDYEKKNRRSGNKNVDIMNYELQQAKRVLRDNYGISDDGIIEAYRKKAAEEFSSTERMERISEIVDWFDRILSEEHEGKLNELAERRAELNKAIEEKDKSKYLESAGVTETQDAKQRLLNTELSDLELSVRATKFITDNKINTVADVVQYNRAAFARAYNPSSAVLKEIVGLVNKLGLQFGMDVSSTPSVSWETALASYERELGEIQEKLDSYDRMSALREIGPQAIFDEIQQKFADLASLADTSDAGFIDALRAAFPDTSKNFIKKNLAWYRDQVKKVVDNFPVLREEACRELETSEHVHIDIRLDLTVDRSNDRKNDEENSEGEEEGDVSGIENQYKETWMYEYDTTSNWDKMSAQVRHMLYRCPLGKRRTRFGTEYTVPVMQVINTLIQEMQGVTTSREMDLMLEYMEKDYPWISYIRQQISQDSKLKSQLFRSIRRYTQQLGILKKDEDNPRDFSKNRLNIINSGNTVDSIMTSAKRQIASGIPSNRSMSIYNDRELDERNIDKAISVLEKYVEFDRYNNPVSKLFTAGPSEVPDLLKENPDLINDLHAVLTAMGFVITPSDIRVIAARDVRRGIIRQNNNLGVLWAEAHHALELMKGNGYETTGDLLNEYEHLSSDNRAMSSYTKIAKVLTLADRGAVEASKRENGKVRYSYVLPSVLDDLIVGLQGKKFSVSKSKKAGKRVNLTTREYIEKKFGKDPRYSYKTEDGKIHYRNHVLEALAYGESGITGSGISYVTILNVDTGKRDKTEQKDLTQTDRLNMLWSMYHQDPDKVEYLNAQGTWYPIPLPSDSGRMAYIRFTDVGDDIRDDAIREQILKELERMTDNSSDAHLPKTFRDNKNRFCTFPILNDSDIVSHLDPSHLDDYSVQKLLEMYVTGEVTSQFADLDDILDHLVAVVKKSMVEKFKEENPAFYEMRKNEVGEARINGFIVDQSVFQMGINEIINGDAAYYSAYNKGSDNEQKRSKQSIVPLDHLDIYNEDFLNWYRERHGIAEDEELEEDDIVEHVIYINDPQIPSPSWDDLKMLYDDALENGIIDQETHDSFLYDKDKETGAFIPKKIKYTDGQALRSFDSMKAIMYAMGEMKKGDDLDRALDRIASGKQQPGDSYIVRTALKPFLSGLIPIDEGSDEVRLMPVQHKLSEQIMTAALVQASATRLGKSNALIAFSEFMDEERVDAIIFTSGVKAGQNGAVNFGDMDVESASKEEIIDRIREEMDRYREATGGMSLVHQIPLSLWGIVAQNPDTGFDDKIPIGVQLQKLIAADLLDTFPVRDADGNVTYEKALYPVYGIGDLTRDEIIALYNRLMTEKILREYEDVTGTFADKKKLSEKLQQACRNSSRNSAYLERAFSLDEYGNFVIPLCDLATLNMSSEFLNSIVKNAVSRVTAPGKSLVSMSAFGVANDLKIEFERDENDRPIRYKSIDCLLPAWSKPIIDKCTDENGILDFEKVSKESPRLLYAIGVRIPTQFKNFVLPLKVVGFLPPILGDTIVTAIDSVLLQDSDFDNDKVPTIFPTFEVQEMIDNWEDKAYQDYKEYCDKWYDFAAIHGAFKNFMKEAEAAGTELADYDFKKFYHEEKDKPYFENKYRRSNAPEGKPMPFYEYKEINKNRYLRPGGSLLKYVEFDPNKDIRKQSNGAIDNALINVMFGMLTGRAVSTMSLAAGDTGPFKKIKNEIEKLTPKGRYADYDGPADIASRIAQETRNNDGKQMISVFANAEAMQAILQHTDVGLVPGTGAIINGRQLESLHDVTVELSELAAANADIAKNPKSALQYISRYIGTSVGAAADNSKDPMLAVMNINLRTAPVVSLMLQLGYTMEEVALFLNIPSIRHYTDTGDFGDYYEKREQIELLQELPGGLEQMKAAIMAGDKFNDMTPELQEYCQTALGVFLYLEEIGEKLRMLSSLARGDSGGTRPHGPIENNLVRLLNYELFEESENNEPTFENWRQVVQYSYEQDASLDEVLGAKNPLAQAYITYGVVGAFRELEQYYPGIGDPNFRKQLKDIIKKYYGGRATVTNVKNVLFALYNYIESSYDCMCKDGMSFEESRNYYLNIFPEEAAEIVSNYESISNSLLFRRLKLYSALESDEDPFISLDYEGTMLPEVRDEISAVWQQLFYAKDENGNPNMELRELALDLFKYCYFRNGFRFGNGTFAHLAPAEARLLFPGYAEMLDDMQTNPKVIDSSRFEQQFVRNNLYDYHFCETVPPANRRPDNWIVNGVAADSLKIKHYSKMDESHQDAMQWYFPDPESDAPRNAFLITNKTKEGIEYYYYIKVAEDDVNGVSTYARTTPLGWKDKSVEYSAKEGGLSMLSAFDQDMVAASVRGKKGKKKSDQKKKNYDEARRKSSTSGNSSEEPNEAPDDTETYKGFKTYFFTDAGYKEALSEYPSIAKSKKFKDARASWLKSNKSSGKSKESAKSKQQVEKEKKGGNKSRDKFRIVDSASKNGTIAAEEAACAQEFGTYTICITDNESGQLGKMVKQVAPETRLASVRYDPTNAYDIANEIARKLSHRTNKSIVLNLTGSRMNTLSKYTTQDDLDGYVLRVYKALKDRGIFVSKVVSTAQPGVALASARAAIKLGYSLEIHPTSDYKVQGDKGKAVSDKDTFLSNLGSTKAKKDGRIYDKEDGPFLTAMNPWTRSVAAKDKKTIYLFPDNPERKSGMNRVASATKYAKKYGGLRFLSYPDSGPDSIRGLENAFPISTVGMNGMTVAQFRKAINDEINDIIEALESGEYKRVVLPSEGIFGDITESDNPKLYKELVKQIENLRERVEEIADTDINEEGDNEGERDGDFLVDTNDILGGNPDEIRPLKIVNGTIVRSNIHVIDVPVLSSKYGIDIYNSDGDKVTEERFFVVIPFDANSPSVDAWPKAKLYTKDGVRITENLSFTLKGESQHHDLLKAKTPNGKQALAVASGLNLEVNITSKVPYNTNGLITWLDDNNQPICK